MNIALSSVLLFALSIPFVMTYRISPGDTPYWLFGLIFLGLFSYAGLDLIKLKKEQYVRFKSILMWLVIAGTLGAGFVSAIIVRHQVAPIFRVHDIILQQEAAIRFLIDGVNPYATNYFGTHLEAWHFSDTEVNPALYHFVMQPFYLIFAIPFYGVALKTIGYFDGRIPLFFLFFSLLVMAFRLVKDTEKRMLLVILLAFNPAMLQYTLEGRSDVFMYAFLFAGFYLLHLKKYSFSGIFMALAFAVKQSAWPLFPFYFAYLYVKNKDLVKTIKQLLPFVVTFSIFVLPFFFWDPHAFVDSTILYLSGSTEHSYPVSGYGFGMILQYLGFIHDKYDYYPFVIWQAIIGTPLLIVLLKYLKKNPSVKAMIIAYTLFLFVFWYFSRYFNNSHLGYLSMLLITAYFWPNDHKA